MSEKQRQHEVLGSLASQMTPAVRRVCAGLLQIVATQAKQISELRERGAELEQTVANLEERLADSASQLKNFQTRLEDVQRQLADAQDKLADAEQHTTTNPQNSSVPPTTVHPHVKHLAARATRPAGNVPACPAMQLTR